jgi:hypothetical protein
MGKARREHEQHQDRQAAAHEQAAAVHDQAAQMHQDVAEFFDEHGRSDQAGHEQRLARAEERGAVQAREQAAADQER